MEYKSPGEQFHTRPPLIVKVSLAVFRLLLFTYPVHFRNEYAVWMTQAFCDQCVRAYRLSGSSTGIPRLWIDTLLDWLKTSLEQRTMKGVVMTHSLFTRICGWCLMLSVAAIMLGVFSSSLYSGTTDPQNGLYRPYDPLLRAGQLVLIPTWVLLTAVGIAGLYTRFGAASGRVGRSALALGVLGGIASFGLFAVLGLAGENEPAGVWELAMIGLLFMFGGLFVFGLSSLRGRELNERSWLPLATGGSFLLMMVLSNVLTSDMPTILPVLFFGLIACGLFLLGRLLLRSMPQQTA
jgi:hypothetical protein